MVTVVTVAPRWDSDGGSGGSGGSGDNDGNGGNGGNGGHNGGNGGALLNISTISKYIFRKVLNFK